MGETTGRFAIVAALVAALVACGGKPESEVLAAAEEALASKDPGAAVVGLKAHLERQPESAAGRFLLGKALLARGDATAAEIELAKAERLKHDVNQVAPERARALVAAGDPAKALQQYRSLRLSEDRSEADLKVTLAGAAAATGKPELAHSLLAEAAKAGPEPPRAALLRARLELAAGKPEAALSRLDAARSSGGPEAADAWVLTGEIQQSHRKDAGAALAAFRQALQADSSNVAAHRGVVLLLLAGGDTQGAAEQLKTLERVKPGQPAAKVLHAMLALAQGNHAGVRERVQPLLNASPNNPTLLELAGTAEFHLNALDKAETLLKAALQRAPQLTMARQTLAQVYLQRGQPEPALETLAPLLNAGAVPAPVAALASQAHLLAGNSLQAQKLLAAGQAAHPEDERIRLSQIIARLAQGDNAAALADLEAMARRSPNVTADAALIAHHLRKKDWARAMTAIDGLARKQPAAPAVHLLRGQVLAARGDRAGARASYETALKTDPRLLPALQGLAGLDIAEGKPDLARQRLSELVAQRPEDARAQLALAHLMDRVGTPPEDVATQLSKAVSASPQAVTLRLQLINTLLRNAQVPAAKAAVASAVAAIPGNAELLHAQGRVSLAAGELQQAANAFNEVAKTLPKSPQLQLDLATVRIGQGDFGGAERHLRQALALAPEMPAAQEALLATLLRSRRDDAALTFARQVQQRQPASAVGHFFEGDTELQRQRWDAALAAYRQALRLEPSTRSAVRLHTATLAAGRSDEAARLARSWRTEHPQHVDFVAYLADLHVRRGDLVQAEADYREVLRLQPGHAGALNNLAWLLVKQGKPEALAMAERARAAAPYSAVVQDTLAMALAAEGKLTRAVEIQARLVERFPNQADYRLHLAQLLIEAGDKTKAREHLQILSELGDRYPRQAEVAALRKRA